jgi:hypothetical protein
LRFFLAIMVLISFVVYSFLSLLFVSGALLVTCMKRENDGTREASPKPKTRRSTGGPLPHSVGLRRGQDNRRVWSHTGPGPYHRRYHWSHRNRRSSQQQRVLSITCFQEGIYKPRGPASKNRQKRQSRRNPYLGSLVCEKTTSNSVNRGVPRHRFRRANSEGAQRRSEPL